eukprot:scaffold123493_cov25-Tisochrysis_lutea.AAC.2
MYSRFIGHLREERSLARAAGPAEEHVCVESLAKPVLELGKSGLVVRCCGCMELARLVPRKAEAPTDVLRSLALELG